MSREKRSKVIVISSDPAIKVVKDDISSCLIQIPCFNFAIASFGQLPLVSLFRVMCCIKFGTPCQLSGTNINLCILIGGSGDTHYV